MTDSNAHPESECTYYKVPGMMYPYWAVTADNAHNLDADTDMGDLTVEEFTDWLLPMARRITKGEALTRPAPDEGGA